MIEKGKRGDSLNLCGAFCLERYGEWLLGERQDCFWWSQRIGLKRGSLNVVRETDFGVGK